MEGIDRLMYQIVWHSQKQLTQMLNHPDMSLTFPQLVTLLAVQECGSCRMTTLADITRQSAGTLTGIVDRMIADDLLERTRNANDRRVIEVALTSEGIRRANVALSSGHQQTQQALVDFSDGEVEQFTKLLQRFLDNLHRTTEQS